MKIENNGIVISEIFTLDEGESIEIGDGGVTLTLRGSSNSPVEVGYSPACFRELLAAMNAADQELIKIEKDAQP